jgi:hypothetical protein
MTQLLCAANQTIPPLLSHDEMKVKVYNPGSISHDAALPRAACRAAHHAAIAAAVTFVSILIIVAAIVTVSVPVAAAAFS